MNKSNLVDEISNMSGLTKADSERALNALLNVTIEALKAGDEVAIVGFGSFCIKETAARNGRDFKTGKVITIPARKSVKFKPGKNLKIVN